MDFNRSESWRNTRIPSWHSWTVQVCSKVYSHKMEILGLIKNNTTDHHTNFPSHRSMWKVVPHSCLQCTAFLKGKWWHWCSLSSSIGNSYLFPIHNTLTVISLPNNLLNQVFGIHLIDFSYSLTLNFSNLELNSSSSNLETSHSYISGAFNSPSWLAHNHKLKS